MKMLFALWLLAAGSLFAAAQDFRVHVTVAHQKDSGDKTNSGVVVWLTPIGQDVQVVPLHNTKLTQKNKQFLPHLLVVTVGTVVDFPNLDPYFHNVFSLYKGKRFDLGLYEAGSSRSVKFERAGVSFIFCNIHPEMSAAVVALPTPYFAVSNASGEATIPNVPNGKYRMQIWYERAAAEALQSLAREVDLGNAREPLRLNVAEALSDKAPHKNKYGEDYDRSRPYGPE